MALNLMLCPIFERTVIDIENKHLKFIYQF